MDVAADDLDSRLEAVERALTDGETALDLAELEEAAAVEDRLDAVESDLTALSERVADLEAATQALRGYVGDARATDDEVERRADAALAKVEALERRVGDGANDAGVPDDARVPDDDAGVADDAGGPRDGGADGDGVGPAPTRPGPAVPSTATVEAALDDRPRGEGDGDAPGGDSAVDRPARDRRDDLSPSGPAGRTPAGDAGRTTSPGREPGRGGRDTGAARGGRSRGDREDGGTRGPVGGGGARGHRPAAAGDAGGAGRRRGAHDPDRCRHCGRGPVGGDGTGRSRREPAPERERGRERGRRVGDGGRRPGDDPGVGAAGDDDGGRTVVDRLRDALRSEPRSADGA